MKQVRLEEAVGMVLGHDLTKIVPGQYKGRAFKKGHIIRPEDVPELLSIGKEHVYIVELGKGEVHEDDAALRLAAILCGPGTAYGEPSEGKVAVHASIDGLFSVNKEAVYRLNYNGRLSVATLHGNMPVKKGEQVAGIRFIPLVVSEKEVSRAENIAAAAGPVIKVSPYLHHKVGIIATGSEVYTRRIEDRFTPVVLRKLSAYPAYVLKNTIVNDDKEKIRRGILDLYSLGAEMIIVTGGMSVDPDDRTPAAIRETGAQVVTYGTPVLPGNMLMLAYLGQVPVLGLPGCVMYNSTTVFDLILPRLFAGERLTRRHFTEMSVGGLCSNCEQCRYPNCRFGRS